MKKSLLVAALLSLAFLLPAQDFYKQGRFVIQGRVKGYALPTIDFGMTTFFNNVQNSVAVKSDGTFSQSFPVQHRQDIYFLVNDNAISFTVYDGDTLKLTWDEADFQKTFRIEGKNKTRTKELTVERARHWQVRRGVHHLFDSLSKSTKEPDPKLVNLQLNKFYNLEVQTILDIAGSSISTHFNYLLTEAYFRYAKTMSSMARRSKEPFRPRLQLEKKRTYPSFWIADTINGPSPSRTLREDWWLNVPEYRDYLFTYVRFGQPENGRLFDAGGITPSQPLSQEIAGTGGAVATVAAEVVPQQLLTSFTYKDIQNGEKYLYITPVREWFQTQAVMFGFGYYSFEETEQAYATISGKLTSNFLRDTLQKFYKAMSRLKPGNPAPAFTLQDEKGKAVALTDLKGKVVYIDFWGVGCGPCIYEIKNHTAQLQKRYEGKDVVFVNICVDAKGKDWTDALRKYNLGGINLYADGWTKNPVCMDYNVNGIPHNVLVDKAGNITDNNAPRASELLRTGRMNAIDALLK